MYQLNTNTFLALGQNSSTVTKRCLLENPVEETRIIHGPSVLIPPPGCRLIGPGYTIDGTRDMYFTPSSVHFRYLDLAQSITNTQDPLFISHMHRHQLDSIGSKKGLKIKNVAAALEHENHVRQVTFFVSVGTGIVIMILIVTCCYCYCKGYPKRLVSRQSKRRSSDNLELQLRGGQQQPIFRQQNRPLLNQPQGLPAFEDLG